MTNTIETIVIKFNKFGDDAASKHVYEAIAKAYAQKIEKRFPDSNVEVSGANNFEVMLDDECDGRETDEYSNFITNALGHADVALMNPETGSVDTKEQWESESKDWEGDIEAQLASLVEVVRINGEWVEA